MSTLIWCSLYTGWCFLPPAPLSLRLHEELMKDFQQEKISCFELQKAQLCCISSTKEPKKGLRHLLWKLANLSFTPAINMLQLCCFSRYISSYLVIRFFPVKWCNSFFTNCLETFCCAAESKANAFPGVISIHLPVRGCFFYTFIGSEINILNKKTSENKIQHLLYPSHYHVVFYRD